MSDTKKTIKKTTTKKEVVKEAPATEKKESKKISANAKFIKAIGRRKTAVAQIRMFEKGDGEILVNNVPAENYFKKEENLNIILQPLKVVSKLKDFNFTIIVKGGGVLGQLEAVRHGIARALVKYDPEFKTILKTSGYITRDPRQKERKKPGLKKARKSPQWSKR
ncbi:MAG TPA: 30S ribosomal protein S9 [bacterium]|nr:30S ribosomal protein S9 [bacterium]